MPIRILHVLEAAGVGGGVENGVANLIHDLPADRFEHIICGISHVGPQIERYPSGRVTFISLDQKPRRMASQAMPLARLIRDLRPHIVHSRNWGAMEAVAAARWVGSPVAIHSEHGVEADPRAEPRRRGWIRRFAFELAHRIFSVSYELRDSLALRTGFSRQRIDVIHNGVSASRFRPDPEARRRLRAQLGIVETDFCIGCVGRLSQIKDYPTLLKAARLLRQEDGDWRLLIAGKGPELASLRGFSEATSELHGRVSFLGSVNNIPEFLNALDVFVLPSICEGISNALLEAMATGLPAVATAVGGNREVLVDGESGILFPARDANSLAYALMRLRRDREFGQRLGAGAVARILRDFSLQSMVRNYQNMYESLVGRRIPQPASRYGAKIHGSIQPYPSPEGKVQQ